MINNENGLPPKFQQFMDQFLHTQAERALFVKTFHETVSELDRQEFLARYAEALTDDDLPADEELRQATAALEKRNQEKRDQAGRN